MADDDKTLFVRMPREQMERLEAWIAQTNATLPRFAPKMEKAGAVRVLIERGIEAMEADHAAAMQELAGGDVASLLNRTPLAATPPKVRGKKVRR